MSQGKKRKHKYDPLQVHNNEYTENNESGPRVIWTKDQQKQSLSLHTNQSQHINQLNTEQVPYSHFE